MAAFKYDYAISGIITVPAQAVGEMLETLSNSPTGLTPKTLVDANRAEGSLLHNEFEWRDDVAAEKYRESQAAKIIRNVVIIENTTNDEEEDRPVRGFCSTPGCIGNYVTLQTALTNEAFKAKLMEDAKRDAKAFLGKYRRLERLSSVNNAIERFLHDVG